MCLVGTRLRVLYNEQDLRGNVQCRRQTAAACLGSKERTYQERRVQGDKRLEKLPRIRDHLDVDAETSV